MSAKQFFKEVFTTPSRTDIPVFFVVVILSGIVFRYLHLSLEILVAFALSYALTDLGIFVFEYMFPKKFSTYWELLYFFVAIAFASWGADTNSKALTDFANSQPYIGIPLESLGVVLALWFSLKILPTLRSNPIFRARR